MLTSLASLCLLLRLSIAEAHASPVIVSASNTRRSHSGTNADVSTQACAALRMISMLSSGSPIPSSACFYASA